MSPPARPPLLARLNWYWICQLAGWSASTLFQLVLYRDFPGVAKVAACTWLLSLLVSDTWHRFIKACGWNRRAFDWRLLAGSVFVLAPVMVAGVALAIHFFLRPITDFRWLPISLLSWGSVFVSWHVCYGLALALRRANRSEAEALRLEVHAKDAELRALQAQVNPHFFFNSLNSVRALIYEDPEAAAQMIDRLAGLMRYALQSGQAETVPLAAELAAVDDYLAIEKIRFEERLRVRLDIEAGLENVRIPPMALQTLVENAVKYGVELNAAGSDIRIHARRAGPATQIDIVNTGTLRGDSGSTRVGLAVGLTNTRKRLALAVGAGATLDLSEHDGQVCASLHLPAAAA